MIKKIIALMCILLLIVPSAMGANGKVTEKITDKTGIAKNKITTSPSDFQVSVSDTDISAYTVNKKSKTEVSIHKKEVKGKHTKATISVPSDDLTALDEAADNDGFIGYIHRADDGTVLDYGKMRIADIVNGDAATFVGMFSSIDLNGFSGITTGTKTITMANSTISFPSTTSSSNVTVVMNVSGGVNPYSAINPHNKSSYPNSTNLMLHWNFENVTGNKITSEFGGLSGTMYNSTASNGIWSSNTMAGGSISNPYTRVANEYNYTYIMKSRYTASHPSATSQQLVYIYGNIIKLSYITSSKTLGVYNASNGVQSATLPDIQTGQHTIVYQHDGVYNKRLYYDQKLVVSTSIKSIDSYTQSYFLSHWLGVNNAYNGQVDDIALYNTVIPLREAMAVVNGYSGSTMAINSPTSTRYPMTASTSATVAGPVTSANILSNTNESKSVTWTLLFTANTTNIVETETETAFYRNTSLMSPSQIHNGSFGFDIPTSVHGYTKYNDPVLVSNNPNASVVRDGYNVTVYTGYVPAGATRYYNIVISYIEGDTEIDNTFIDTYRTMSDNIDNAFVLSGVLFTICIGITILSLLAGTLTGNIDYRMSAITVGVLIVSEIVILVGVIIMSSLFEGLI